MYSSKKIYHNWTGLLLTQKGAENLHACEGQKTDETWGIYQRFTLSLRLYKNINLNVLHDCEQIIKYLRLINLASGK